MPSNPDADDADRQNLLRRGVLFMVASAFAFAAMAVCVKLAGERLPSLEIVFVRAVISLGLSLALLRRVRVPLLGTNRRLLFLRGLFGFVGLSCVFYSVTHLPLAEATVLHYLYPIFTALLAAAFLAERISGRHAIGAALAFGGTLLVVQRSTGVTGAVADALPTFAVWVAIAGAFCSACAYTVVRRLAKAAEHPLVIVLYFPLITVPATLPFMWNTAIWPTHTEWLLLLGVGIFAQIGQVALTRGMQHEPAGRATVLSYLQVPFSAAIGVIAFGEHLGWATITGAIIILAGARLAVR